MGVEKAINIADLRRMAKRRLPRIAFDFIDNSAEDELGLARNIDAFRQWCLLPRYLVDVSARDQSTTLFGQTFSSPFGFGPTGTLGFFRRGAELMLAEAAADANIPYVMAGAANSLLEDAAKIAPEHTWYQIYPAKDRAITHHQIGRARDAGLGALLVTVDVPMRTKRERNMRNGYNNRQKLTLSAAVEALAHPGWLAEYIRHRGLPNLANWKQYAPEGANIDRQIAFFNENVPAVDDTWADIEEYRRLWPRKMAVKGILHPDDARRAVDLGVDGIVVSNHGGRQLDRAPATLEMLPAIVEAVAGRATVILDSGVRRGSDIITALCLGADFVFIGRPGVYGVAAGGAAGAKRAVAILRQEVDHMLGQIGCPTIDGLGPHFLWRDGKALAEPPAEAGARAAAE